MKKKFIDAAKGQHLQSKVHFCEIFDALPLSQKIETVKNLNQTLATGYTPHAHIAVKTEQTKAIEQLRRWCIANLQLGGDVIPPETLNEF